MFDISFAELILIGIVALLVIGPERLPETVRTVAKWIGRARRSYSHFRKELEREIGADEIRRDLRNEAIMEDLRRTGKELQQTTTEIQQGLRGTSNNLAADPSIAGGGSPVVIDETTVPPTTDSAKEAQRAPAKPASKDDQSA